MSPYPHFVDLAGQTFGRLLVISRAADHVQPSGARVPRWHCRCECGVHIAADGGRLRTGKTRSCGCLRRDDTSARNRERRRDDITYSGAHQRVRLDRGRAAEHLCVDCNAQAQDWSYDGRDPAEMVEGRLHYSTDSMHYEPRCRPCHIAHDKVGR